MSAPKTLGELRATGYRPKSIKDELRDNLVSKLRSGTQIFDDIQGYNDTVIPDIQRAILSRHNILLLGLRGQAKTRIARLLVDLLDDRIPIIEGLEIYDDPVTPITRMGRDKVAEMGENTPIKWVERKDRYVEKLATPDVSVADLIGDVDPIKAAAMKLPYSDERVLHYGLVPRSHRSIFVLNELPDLQPRIQVSLFNILQEGDIQIRGFKLRLPLDIQFVFTANPEDYTNRGSIITPLKDRIESQILTHYPLNIDLAKKITQQEVRIPKDQRENVVVPDVLHNIIERIAFIARDHEMVDPKSGVSVRLTISAYENLVSAAYRRTLLSGEDKTKARIGDLWGIIPAITGKVELVYEGEQEGPYEVAMTLIGEALKDEFLLHFPDPDKSESQEHDPFKEIKNWFRSGHKITLLMDEEEATYEGKLKNIEGLYAYLDQKGIRPEDQNFFAEFLIYALVEFDVITKELVGDSTEFRDILADMFDGMSPN